MTGYVSPYPAKDGPNYRNRIEGAPVVERMHSMPRSDGGEETCQPHACRECERERNWALGQIRGSSQIDKQTFAEVRPN